MIEKLPTALPHKSYIKATPIQSCHYILELPDEDQCEFVESTPECIETVHYINYIMLVFCHLGKLYGVPLLILWLLILCGFIITISTRFYTNAVLYLTRILGFSEFLGGMTILCFGNSLNKLMSTVIQADNDTELFYNQILGTTIFLLTFTMGLIVIQSPFQLHKGQFIMMTLFILAALIVLAFIVYDSVIGMYEVVALLSLFIVFFTITTIGHKRLKEMHKKRLKLSDDILNEAVEENVTEVVQLRQFTGESDIEEQSERLIKLSGWKMFLRYMKPFDMKQFKKSGKVFKAILIVFVVYTYLASIHLIYIILLELISGLHTIGVLCGLQRATIGGTFLAWANGLINIFTNIVLCHRKFNRMAITSTFVEAFFILTIGIGSTMLIRLLFHHDWTYRFRSGVNGPTCLIFLFIMVIYNWFTTCLMHYQARRSLGIFMLVTYLVFVTFLFLCEEEILHPYGTDHIRQIENIDNDMYRIN
ncbi:mitochondrial sodium/calcium exchanger protein-like [Culicoides brevitarsis]|uniref:mitochondrial sodium/calcium exchanger protein-like n=1 Tax=Culicoides brevitarsis TaxID=469753 RepID=UPI00307C5E01